MRLTGPLNLTLDGPPQLGFYASRAYGGFLAFDIFEMLNGEKNPRAEVTLFLPPAFETRLARAVAAFNAAMAEEAANDRGEG
ncbi:MAG: hypothetical protein WB816_01270 [Methylocystis sp.]